MHAGIKVFSETGERMDFHALCATFRMFLHKNKVSLETTVILTRHSDPRLAMREYLDASQLELSSIVSSMKQSNALVGQLAQ